MTDAKDLPFDQVVTALRNWSRGIPDIRARDPEALASRVLYHIAALEARIDTRSHVAERAVVEAAKAWATNQRGWLKPLDEALAEAVDALRAREGDA
jgi:hypothetical protein